MNDYTDITEYAKHVRRVALQIMGAASAGLNTRAGELAAVLCSEAATIANQSMMETELSGASYDLATLQHNPFVNDECPFRDE